MKKFIICLLAVFTLSLNLWAKEELPPTKTWDESKLTPDIIERIGANQLPINNILFDAVDDVRWFKFDFKDDFDIGVKTKRDVYDNQDILESWTVVDEFEIDGSIPIWNTEDSPFNFWVGVNGQIRILNIRQVLPKDYSVLSSIEEEKNKLESSGWYQDFKETDVESKGEWGHRLNPQDPKASKDILEFLQKNPEDHARFSNLINQALLPTKLPLSVEKLKKMQNGEVVAYGGSGTLEFGVRASTDWSGLEYHGDLGVSVRTFLNGNYQISVLKENDRFVRVKVHRLLQTGHGEKIYTELESDFLDGVFLIKKLNRHLEIVPFEFSWRNAWGRSLDIGYRYDLENPKATEAYERAVKGQFSYSEELAYNALGESLPIETNGVMRDFTRVSNQKTRTQGYEAKAGFIFKNESESSISNVEAMVTTPDGQFHYFNSLVRNSKKWKAIWGAFEKLEHRFVATVDLKKYKENPDSLEAFGLIIEGTIDDSHTNRAEMMSYILEAENSIGLFNVFPRPPTREELSPEGEKKRSDFRLLENGLGRSRFYYKTKLNHEQLQKFIDTPQDKMWLHLEKAFQVIEGSWSSKALRVAGGVWSGALTILTSPLYLIDSPLRGSEIIFHANSIQSKWKKLKKIANPKEKIEMLGSMLFNRRYSYDLARLFRSTLNEEIIPYTISAYSDFFGKIWEEGNGGLFIENLATRFQNEIDFDRKGPRHPDSENGSQIQNLEVLVKNSNQVLIQFVTQKPPKAIYLGLVQEDESLIFSDLKKKLVDLVLLNNGNFVEGLNTIVLDPLNPDSPTFPVASKLVLGEEYRIRLATNVDGTHWGPAASIDLIYSLPEMASL